jgi:hypothetical protein
LLQKLFSLLCTGSTKLFFALCYLTLLFGVLAILQSLYALLRDRFGTFRSPWSLKAIELPLDTAIVLGGLLLLGAVLRGVANWSAGLAILLLFLAGIPGRGALSGRPNFAPTTHWRSLLHGLTVATLIALAVFLLIHRDGLACQ